MTDRQHEVRVAHVEEPAPGVRIRVGENGRVWVLRYGLIVHARRSTQTERGDLIGLECFQNLEEALEVRALLVSRDTFTLRHDCEERITPARRIFHGCDEKAGVPAPLRAPGRELTNLVGAGEVGRCQVPAATKIGVRKW